MTRSERINKLAGAIKRYKGAHVPAPGGMIRWIRSPKPSARDQIIHWSDSLRLDTQEVLFKIEGFKTREEFESWLRTL